MSLHHHFGGFWCLWRHGFVFPSFLLVSIVCIESTQQHLNNFWGGCLLGELIFWDWVFCPSKSKTPWESDKSSWGCRSRKTSHRPGTWKTSILEMVGYQFLWFQIFNQENGSFTMFHPFKNMVVFGVVNLLWCVEWNGRNTEVFAATWFQAGRGAILKKRLNPLVRQVIPRYTPVN